MGGSSTLSTRQNLGHQKSGVAGRVAFDLAKHLPALPLVKAGGLERQGGEDRMAAAATRSLFLGCLQDPAA
jgi:hypothetical protein